MGFYFDSLNICFGFNDGTKHQLPNYSPFEFQDPAGFEEALAGGVAPVAVGESNRKKRRVKGKGKPTKKAKTSKANGAKVETESKEKVLSSFTDLYQNIIKSLPVCLWPTSSKHGEHSYTVLLG